MFFSFCRYISIFVYYVVKAHRLHSLFCGQYMSILCFNGCLRFGVLCYNQFIPPRVGAGVVGWSGELVSSCDLQVADSIPAVTRSCDPPHHRAPVNAVSNGLPQMYICRCVK